MEFVIIRSPVVYGPGVKGNINFILKLIKYRCIFPKRVLNNNLRSIVSVENLSQFIVACLENPNASNQILIIKDSSDKSTEGIIRLLAAEQLTTFMIFPLPIRKNFYYLKKICREKCFNSLLENMVVDNSLTIEKMNWKSG